MKIIIVLFFVLLISCEQNIKIECIHKEHVKYTFNQLDKMDAGFDKAENFEDDLLYINLFLQKITKIESKAYFGDVYFYESRKNYKEDLRNWKKWLILNNCNIDSMDVEILKKEMIKFRELHNY